MSNSHAFAEALDGLSRWFERQKRVLPWREEPTPYRVWVSEIMLQQTQVATVVPYFERFVKRFPSVEALAAAPTEDVMAHWAGLGYYSRARNLKAAAGRIVAAGRFPCTREEWLDLPGIGPYTAGAILSISADQPEPILDGNVERVLCRVRHVSRAVESRSDSRSGEVLYKARLWRLARIFVERAQGRGIRPSVLNQALMELGATVCVPRAQPACLLCPLGGVCRARAAGDAPAYPPAKRAKEWVQVEEELHGWVRLAEGGSPRILLRQRAKGEWRAGLWDLMDRAPETGVLLGAIETRHVVTRHKIRRVTQIWRVDSAAWSAREAPAQGAPHLHEGAGHLMKPAEAQRGEMTCWAELGDPQVPLGSAGKQSLYKIQEALENARKTRERNKRAKRMSEGG